MLEIQALMHGRDDVIAHDVSGAGGSTRRNILASERAELARMIGMFLEPRIVAGDSSE
jgi:hypothetical protein